MNRTNICHFSTTQAQMWLLMSAWCLVSFRGCCESKQLTPSKPSKYGKIHGQPVMLKQAMLGKCKIIKKNSTSWLQQGWSRGWQSWQGNLLFHILYYFYSISNSTYKENDQVPYERKYSNFECNCLHSFRQQSTMSLHVCFIIVTCVT